MQLFYDFPQFSQWDIPMQQYSIASCVCTAGWSALVLAARHCTFPNVCWLRYEILWLLFAWLLDLKIPYLLKVLPLLMKTSSNRWCLMMFSWINPFTPHCKQHKFQSSLLCTEGVFPPQPRSASPTLPTLCITLCLPAALHYAWYDGCVISDACLHKWPTASRAELLPSVWAVTMLKHLKPPLLAAAQSRCGSFFWYKTICEVREGQAWGDPGSLQAVFPNGGQQQAVRGAA